MKTKTMKKITPKTPYVSKEKTPFEPPAAPVTKITEIEYTLGCVYRLLREMGHQPMVAAAMLNCLSAGFTLSDIEYAAHKFGDV